MQQVQKYWQTLSGLVPDSLTAGFDLNPGDAASPGKPATNIRKLLVYNGLTRFLTWHTRSSSNPCCQTG